MGIFSGKNEGFHLFVSNDPILEHLGISTYTKDSIKEYVASYANRYELEKWTKQKKNKQEWEDYFLGKNETKAYLKFDKISETYRKQEYDKDLESLIKTHIDLQLGKVNLWEVESQLEDIFSIQNSASGCVTIEYPALTEENDPTSTKLFLQFRSNQKSGNVIAQKSPLIVDIPRKSDGGKYSYQLTIDEQADNIGGFYPPIEGYDEDNQVAGFLRLHFNRSLGMWESGTQQILARLLTDIDAAPVTAIDVDDIDSTKSIDFYGADADFYLSGFTVGAALPLSVHNGNPYTFGPHIDVSKDKNGKVKNKKDKIRVVNRAPRPFSKNSIVLCSFIDAEWIIQDFGDIVEEEKPARVGPWQITKFFASSDAYFQPDFEQLKKYSELVNPNTSYLSTSIYESQMRLRFYTDLKAGTSDGDESGDTLKFAFDPEYFQDLEVNFDYLANINMIIEISAKDSAKASKDISKNDFIYSYMLSNNVFTSSVFDQVTPDMAGTCDANLIARTNPFYGLEADDFITDVDIGDITTFWGPVYVDGYNAAQSVRLKNLAGNFDVAYSGADAYQNNIDSTPSGYYDTQDKYDWSKIDTYFSKGSVIKDGINNYASSRVDGRGMFDDASDQNLKQLPAEIACNGAFVEGTSAAPIEDFDALYFLLNRGVPGETFERQNIPNAISTYLNSAWRFGWLINDNNTTDNNVNAYGLEPVSPNKICFSLCQLEFALHGDTSMSSSYLDSRLSGSAFFDVYRRHIVGDKQSIYHFFGNMFSRSLGRTNKIDPDWGFYNGDIPSGPSSSSVQTPNHSSRVARAGDPEYSVNFIEATNSIDIFSESYGAKSTGSQLQGVIAAKNTIFKKKGGTINISATSMFGIVPIGTSSGGSSGQISILPIGGGVPLFTPPTPSVSNSFKYWGHSISDNINYFGTAAAYVRVFDHWPVEQTLFDPRYHAVLHFNPGHVLSSPDYTTVGNAVNPQDFTRTVDQITFDVDMRVATYAATVAINEDGSVDVDIAEDNGIVPVGTIITHNTPLRPKSEWRVNTIRRGMLLPFRYEYTTVGYNNLDKYIDNGTGFVLGTEVNVGTAIFKVTEVNEDGGITGLAFKENAEGFLERGYDIDPFKDVDPDDENNMGSLVTIRNTNSEGTDAIVFITTYIVYKRIARDDGPLEQKTSTRLIPSSNGGSNRIVSVQSTQIDVEKNDSGAYDCFYHISNDVGINPGLFEQNPGRSPYQYIGLEIT